MRLDVDGLKNSRRRRSDGRRAIVDGGVGRYGTDVRRGEIEEGILLQIHGAGALGSGR